MIPIRELLSRIRRDKVIGQEAVLQSIPLHRIREVYKDGELIWHPERGK